MIDISLPLSETNVIPVEAVKPRREFLTHIEGDDYLLVMDNTAAEKVIRCPTAGYYYIIQGREPHAKNAALTFGGAIHDGIEHFLRDEGKLQVDPKTKKEFIWTEQHTEKAIHQYFMDNPAPPDEYRTVNIAVQVMKHYREQCRVRVDYSEERLLTEGPNANGSPIIEKAFELPLGVLEVDADIKLPQWNEVRHIQNIHVAWSGRIDRLSNLASHDRVVDVKTTSMGGDQFIQSFQLSTQTIGYVWASQQIWPEFRIRSFALDAIHLKKPTKGSGLNGLMEKGPRGGEPALNFFRAYFEYGQERIDQWQHNMLTIIEDFVHCLVRDFFPLYTNHCFNKYGRCPYFDVDVIDNPSIRIRMLKSDAFKDVTWDPTAGK